MPAPEQYRMIFRHIDEPGYSNDLACYVRNGGYEVLRRAVKRRPEELVDEVKRSGLLGRGGAGFPCGVKWTLLDRRSGKPVYLIVNADESEPGTFKDRYIIHQDPHQLIEGIMITCFANKVERAFIYIRGEFPQGARILEKAIAEARAANFAGPDILGTGYGCEIYVHRGAGAYICGEETGLIESLEGKRPYPRIKPPYYPAVLGLYQCPTIVNNVETLCHVKHIADMGGEAFSKIGTLNNTGTRIYCVSGHVQRPGYYEFALGKITLGQLLYEVCGGPLPGRKFKAVIPGGSSAKVLRFGERFKGKRKVGVEMVEYDWGVEDIPLDFDFAGHGGLDGRLGRRDRDGRLRQHGRGARQHQRVLRPRELRAVHALPRGLALDEEDHPRMVHGEARAEDGALLKSVADQIAGRTICAFGEACAWPTQSFVAKFGDEFKAYAQAKKETGAREAPELV
jgi:NADH-quinone oxidoreductase subunit F